MYHSSDGAGKVLDVGQHAICYCAELQGGHFTEHVRIFVTGSAGDNKSLHCLHLDDCLVVFCWLSALPL